jgi:hypothetical protein
VDHVAGQVAVIEEPGVHHSLEADDRLEVDAVAVEPRDSFLGRRDAVHRRTLVPVVVGLLPSAGNGGDARRQQLLPRRPLFARHAREDVAGDDLRGDLGGIEHREAVAQHRVRVEPCRTGLEVRVDVDDCHAPLLLCRGGE